MGEIVEADPAAVRAVADRIAATAEQVAQIRCPELDPGALPGSAAGPAAAAVPVATRLREAAALMRGWAAAAYTSADAFDRAEHDNGERFGRP